MFQDKLQMFHTDSAIAGASAEVDTGSSNAEMPLVVSVNGNGAVATGDATLTLTSSATAGGTYTTDMTVAATAAELNKGITFGIPNHAQRYLKVAVTGTGLSGNITAGLVTAGQTNL